MLDGTNMCAIRMNILFIAPRFHSNQVPLVAELASRGNKIGFAVTAAYTGECHDNTEFYFIPQDRIAAFFDKLFNSNGDSTWRSRWGCPSIRGLYAVISICRWDRVVFRGGASIGSLIFCAIAILKKLDVIYYTQGDVFVGVQSLKQKIVCAVVTKVLKWRWFSPVFGSVGVEKKCCELMDYIPFAMNIPAIERKYTGGQVLRIISVGKFEERKNFHALIKALQSVPLGRWSLTIVGQKLNDAHEAYYRRILSMVNALGLERFVSIKTNLPHREVLILYSGHDLFILPSLNEPASVSHLESMACGVPPVIMRSNGTAGYVKHGVTGFLLDANDVDEISAVVRWAIDHRFELLSMSRQCVAYVKKVHDPSILATYIERNAGSYGSGG